MLDFLPQRFFRKLRAESECLPQTYWVIKPKNESLPWAPLRWGRERQDAVGWKGEEKERNKKKGRGARERKKDAFHFF